MRQLLLFLSLRIYTSFLLPSAREFTVFEFLRLIYETRVLVPTVDTTHLKNGQFNFQSFYIYLNFCFNPFMPGGQYINHKDCIYFSLILLFLDINVSYHLQTLFNRFHKILLI